MSLYSAIARIYEKPKPLFNGLVDGADYAPLEAQGRRIAAIEQRLRLVEETLPHRADQRRDAA